MSLLARFFRDDRGQDLIEYVILTSVISVGSLLGATALGVAINGWFDKGAIWVGGAGFP